MSAQRPDESMISDPLGCEDDLLRALSRPELSAFDNEDGRIDGANERAALWLAVALGRCRLFGVDPGENNGVLPQRTAIAAAVECSRQLRHLAESVYALARQWDAGDIDADSGLEAGQFLFVRMDFWAAAIAIDEAYEAALLDRNAVTGEFRRVIRQLTADGQALDSSMQENTDIFCTAANTEMLDNWQGLLASPYLDALPWWLDETLEAVANQIEETALATQPSDAAWRKFVTSRPDVQRALDTSEKTAEAGRANVREPPVVRPLEKLVEDFAEAIRRLFTPEVRFANTCNSETKEVKVLLDSQEDLAPIRGTLYQMPNGDLRLELSCSDDTLADQTYEVIVEEQTLPTVTFDKSRRGGWFGRVEIPRDQLPKAGLSKLGIRLKKL